MWHKFFSERPLGGLFGPVTSPTVGSLEGHLPCEKALFAATPLFAYKAKQTNNGSLAELSAQQNPYAISLQTFLVSFDFEASMLRETLSLAGTKMAMTNQAYPREYTERLIDILEVFEHLIQPGILENTAQTAYLKLGTQTFPKLHALYLREELSKADLFPKIQHLIKLPVDLKESAELLGIITGINRILQGLLDGTDTSLVPLPSHTAIRFPLAGPSVRARLEGFHEILDRTWKTSRCPSPSHKVRLRLSTSGNEYPSASGGEEILSSQTIDVLFSTHDSPCNWTQSRVQVHHQEIEALSKASKVHFAKEPIKAGKSAQCQKPQPINNICKVLDDPKIRKACLSLHAGKFLSDDSGNEKEWFLGILPTNRTPENPLFSETKPTISMPELIRVNKALFNFTRKERRALAVILAHSMLHICETPWLKNELTKEKLGFLVKSETKAHLTGLYLSVDFCGESSTRSGEDEDNWYLRHPCPGLLGLGVILIELEFGEIENYWEDTDLVEGMRWEGTNWLAAQRCLKKERLWEDHPLDPRFKRAIEACIHGDFLYDLDNTTGSNPAFQRAIYNNVVRLLEEELIIIDETTATRLLSNTTSDISFNLPSTMRCQTTSRARSPQVNIPIISQQPTLNGSMQTGNGPNHGVTDFELKGSDSSKVSWAVEFFEKMKKINNLLANREENRAVKVAILDTGVYDGFRQKSNIVSYYDFVDSDFIEGHSASKDNTGHGTDMVHLLQMTAPHAKIYVARVFDGDDSDQNTVRNVAKAIEKSTVEWKVDIISMSFGFITTDLHLEKTIKETKDTLMFAASTNFGATEHRPIRFPARYLDKVFSVNAADGRGVPSGSNPPKDRNHNIRNFSFLGEAVGLVNYQAPGKTCQAKSRYANGSSVATPIASGIAAVVLGFSRQDGCFEGVRNADKLKSLTVMKYVFDGMSKGGPKNQFRFVAPWQMLSSEFEKYNDKMADICGRISEAIEKRHD